MGLFANLLKMQMFYIFYSYGGDGFRDRTLTYQALNYWLMFIRSKLENDKRNM